MDLVYKEGFVYVYIRKGMYGLKQAARISFERLLKLINLMAIIHYVPTLEFGAMKRFQQSLRFVRMILGLNTLILPMLTILSIPYRNNTKYL